MSIGMGVLLTYASYIKKGENLTSISLQVICADTLIAVLAGIAIFPAVFAFNIAPDSGPGLVFLTLPQVFQSMAFGQLWAILFFLLLTMAALTSSISFGGNCCLFVEEKHVSRRKATIISTTVVTIFGILCTLSFGPLKEVHIGNLSIFGIFDYISSNILLPVGGILISIYVGWRFDRRLLEAELTNNGELKLWLLKPLIFILKYVAPLFILVILLHSLGLF
ncbi:MAG: sodium-dependent transporter [Butyricimonas faecalis]